MAGWIQPFKVIPNTTSSLSSDREYNWIVSVIAGILMCKIVYDLTAAASDVFVKGYNKLNDIKKLEWNDRGPSTFHAIVVSIACIHLLLFSDLFKEGSSEELITRRRSSLSDTVQGMSMGYFLCDLSIILWHFPALGGVEYLLHHGLAISSLSVSLVSGKGVVYGLLLLLTESTTPFVNLRWYLDVAGKKSSKLYIFNGVALFFGWLVARILLFVYIFNHLHCHFDEVKTWPLLELCFCTVTPFGFSIMNLIWFVKIAKGTVKALAKLRHSN